MVVFVGYSYNYKEATLIKMIWRSSKTQTKNAIVIILRLELQSAIIKAPNHLPDANLNSKITLANMKKRVV
jgi:hypothetical protein